jgi:hypothetical protein
LALFPVSRRLDRGASLWRKVPPPRAARLSAIIPGRESIEHLDRCDTDSGILAVDRHVVDRGVVGALLDRDEQRENVVGDHREPERRRTSLRCHSGSELVLYHVGMQTAQANPEASEILRKQRFRRTVILLLLAMATPDWEADGSRSPYGMATRTAICASLILGTMLVPVGLRELILALLPSPALGLILGLLIGMMGLLAVPLEIWLVMIVTDEHEPGSQQRYEDGGDDWDWD